jgi:perosamine synthetase
MDVPSTRPFFSEEDIQAISEEVRHILASGQLIFGPHTRQFEALFRDYIGVKQAVCVSTCTAALEIALRYFDVKDKEVIVPTNTFIATSNAVIYSGGHPVLAEINPDTLCLDPAEILKRMTARTRGVIIVHIAGLPCPDMKEIQEICRQNGLFLLEDVAHAHGATIDGNKAGSMAQAGCFSFYPTKVMTTCTGGMLTTNDDKLADYARSLRHYGVGEGLQQIVNLGDDWLMDEISSLLGVYQLRSLEANISRRNEIARKYADALGNIKELEIYKVPANIRHAYYKYAVRLSPDIEKRKLVSYMQSNFNITLGSIYDPPCHLQPIYQKLFGYHHGLFPVTEEVLERTFCLPMYQQMTDEEVQYTIQSLKTALSVFQSGQNGSKEIGNAEDSHYAPAQLPSLDRVVQQNKPI